MAFWTAQLAECVEENVDKRNRVGAVAVLPSIHSTLALVDMDGLSCRELLEGRAHSRSLGYARDDKVEGGGAPWHGWRWMERVEKELIGTSLTFSFPCGTEFCQWGSRSEGKPGVFSIIYRPTLKGVP
jgi:hypothetical protein